MGTLMVIKCCNSREKTEEGLKGMVKLDESGPTGGLNQSTRDFRIRLNLCLVIVRTSAVLDRLFSNRFRILFM